MLTILFIELNIQPPANKVWPIHFKIYQTSSLTSYQIKLNQKHLNFISRITPLMLAKPVPFLSFSSKSFLYNALYVLFFFKHDRMRKTALIFSNSILRWVILKQKHFMRMKIGGLIFYILKSSSKNSCLK